MPTNESGCRRSAVALRLDVQTYPFRLADATQIEQQVGAAAETLGLRISVTTTLRTYPGSLHWHLKRPGLAGVLEITVLPAKAEGWISIHANRQGEWIEPLIPQVMHLLGATPCNDT